MHGMHSAGRDVGKGEFPHLIASPAPPSALLPKFSPATAYLSRLAPSSQLTMAKHLGRLVELLWASSPAEVFPWADLDYGTTLRLRQTLVARYAASHRESCPLRTAGGPAQGVAPGRHLLRELPPHERPRPRPGRPIPPTPVDTRGIERLLISVQTAQTLRGKRDLAMDGAGLRRSELASLDLAQVAGDRLMGLRQRPAVENSPSGTGRGSRPRWLASTPWHGARSFVLPHSSLRSSSRTTPLDRSGGSHRRSAGTCRRRVGELRPHDLRRAFATRLLETGVDVLLVQRILGHRSVATTAIYATVPAEGG
jgi:integrase